MAIVWSPRYKYGWKKESKILKINKFTDMIHLLLLLVDLDQNLKLPAENHFYINLKYT